MKEKKKSVTLGTQWTEVAGFKIRNAYYNL